MRQANGVSGTFQERRKQQRPVEAVPLPIHQHPNRSAQPAAVRHPGRIVANPGE